MKIALVIDRLDRKLGGLQIWVQGFARHLAASSHDVQIVTFEGAERDLWLPVEVLPDPRNQLRRAAAIERHLAGGNFDAVHDTGFGWSADIFHPQTGSNILARGRFIEASSLAVRLRASISPKSHLIRWRMMQLERIQLSRAPRIVAVSEFVRNQLVARFGVDPRRIATIYNGVDTTSFDPARANAARKAERDRLGVSEETIVYLVVANNFVLKGVDTAIRATKRLAQSGYDAHLIIAGSGVGPQWQAQVVSLGLSDRVHFLGYRLDMVAVYGACDAVVHPTRWDACSLCTIEGMACGRPVITTRFNGASELVENERSGYVLADSEDVDGLSELMTKLVDRRQRTEMGRAARSAATPLDIRFYYQATADLLVMAAGARAQASTRR